MTIKQELKQPVLNIGMVGHIDHGKTTLLHKLTGVWASRHSEELKRGITIRLGYADTIIRKCKCGYTVKEKCEKCKTKPEPVKHISFVDAPGHEMLMATMLSGAAIIDAAVLVIAANEPCPQPQTKEHLAALTIKGIKHIIVIQNKIDLVSKEQALKNYHEIKTFVKGTEAENSPIIPVSAQQGINVEVILQELDKIPIPSRNLKANPLFFIARSFDVNKPGAPIEKLSGGVLGGSLKQGILKRGDEIEIRPGIINTKDGTATSVKTVISDLISGKTSLDKALPAGSLAISTKLDPFLTKSDNFSGNIVGLRSKLPETVDSISFKANLFEKVIGTKKELEVEPLKQNENLLLSVNTSVTLGTITKLGKIVTAKLKIPACPIKESDIGIARQIKGRWRLIGYGIVE